MMTIGSTSGEVPGQGQSGMQPGAANGAQGAPGADGTPSEQELDYLQEADPKDGASTPDPSAPEDPRRREARLKRRRRLLAIGGVPAALATIVSLWLGSIFLISLAGNRAAAAGHYDTALSRYRTVATINPWLEQWRVHFNLGTGQLAAKDPTSAVTTLNQALSEAPKATVDSKTKAKEAGSPECMVRTNLYVAHLTPGGPGSGEWKLPGSDRAHRGGQEGGRHLRGAAPRLSRIPLRARLPRPRPAAIRAPIRRRSPAAIRALIPSSQPSSDPSSDPRHRAHRASGRPRPRSMTGPSASGTVTTAARGATEAPGGSGGGGKPW